MVDESKEWQCLFCTYLNSLEVDVCEMCAKSRQSVASGRTGSSQNGSEEFVSGNSQMDNDPNNTTYDESELEYPDTHPNADHDVDKVQCPKCTLFNPADLKVCTVCGASLHKSPISLNGNGSKMRNGGRPQSSASKSSGIMLRDILNEPFPESARSLIRHGPLICLISQTASTISVAFP